MDVYGCGIGAAVAVRHGVGDRGVAAEVVVRLERQGPIGVDRHGAVRRGRRGHGQRVAIRIGVIAEHVDHDRTVFVHSRSVIHCVGATVHFFADNLFDFGEGQGFAGRIARCIDKDHGAVDPVAIAVGGDVGQIERALPGQVEDVIVIAACATVDSVASASMDNVAIVAARQDVVASVAIDHVIARAAGDRVVPVAAIGHIVACVASDPVIAGTAIHQVVVVHAFQQVVSVTAIKRVVPVHTAERVVAVVTIDGVVAAFAQQEVIACVAMDEVIAATGIDFVVTVAAIDGVIASKRCARRIVDQVIARAAIDDVVAGAEFDVIVTVAAIDLVVTGATVKFIVSCAAIDHVRSVTTGDGVAQIVTNDRGITNREVKIADTDGAGGRGAAAVIVDNGKADDWSSDRYRHGIQCARSFDARIGIAGTLDCVSSDGMQIGVAENDRNLVPRCVERNHGYLVIPASAAVDVKDFKGDIGNSGAEIGDQLGRHGDAGAGDFGAACKRPDAKAVTFRSCRGRHTQRHGIAADGQRVAAVDICGCPVKGPRGDGSARSGATTGSRVAVKDVIASAAIDAVGSAAAFDGVVAGAAIQRVVTAFALEGVVAATAIDIVVAVAAHDKVVAFGNGLGDRGGGEMQVTNADGPRRGGAVAIVVDDGQADDRARNGHSHRIRSAGTFNAAIGIASTFDGRTRNGVQISVREGHRHLVAIGIQCNDRHLVVPAASRAVDVKNFERDARDRCAEGRDNFGRDRDAVARQF